MVISKILSSVLHVVPTVATVLAFFVDLLAFFTGFRFPLGQCLPGIREQIFGFHIVLIELVILLRLVSAVSLCNGFILRGSWE